MQVTLSLSCEEGSVDDILAHEPLPPGTPNNDRDTGGHLEHGPPLFSSPSSP